MKPLSLKVAARSDLAAIWRYTRERWSEDQANSYLALIDTALQRLAKGTVRGQSSLGPYRKCRAGSHMIYYRKEDDGIIVVRVLHERMDAARHLG